MRNNAKRGIELNKSKRKGKCATPVGKETSRLLSQGAPLSKARVIRMYKYTQRAEAYYDPSDTSACGTISYLLWGGLAAKRWSEMMWNRFQKEEEKRELSATAKKSLQNKVKEHNEKVSVSHKKATLGMLTKVYNRGVGAFHTNPGSVRPNVSSPEQWAMGRVNSFLYALKNERFRRGKHDTDLFPKGHKLRSGQDDKRMDNLELELRETYGDSVESRVMEIRAAGDTTEMVLEGYAARFDETTNLGYFNERIERGAFDNVLEDDVRFLLNHKGMPMARTSNGTLELRVDQEGLYSRAVLNDTQQSRDVYAAVKRGDISAMSFAFTIGEDDMDSESNTRTVKKVKSMYDVSAVAFPAYPTTTLEARSRAEGCADCEAEKIEKDVAAEIEAVVSADEARKSDTKKDTTFETQPHPRMNLNDLKGQRAAYYEEFVAIGKLADEEGRAMTEAEQERADNLDQLIQDTDAKIKHKTREQEMVKRVAYTAPASTTETEEVNKINNRWSLSRAVNQVRSAGRLEGAEAEWATEARREYRGNGIQMAGEIGIPGFALVRSGSDKFTAAGAAAGGTAADGTGFVSTDVPAAIEALRAPTVLERLGAQVIQAQGNLKFPRVSVKSVPTIAGEISDVESAGLELDEVTMTPERAGANTTYSKQLLIQGGSEVDRLIAGDLRAAMGEIVDTTGFNLIMADSDVDNQSTSGATDTSVAASIAVAMEAAVLGAGGDLSAAQYVMSPTAYKLFKEVALVPSVEALFSGGQFNGYAATPTPHLADETAGSVGQAIFGNFAQGLLIAYFGGMDILVDPFSKAQTAQVQLHATRYFDVAVRQPGAFSIIDDVAA